MNPTHTPIKQPAFSPSYDNKIYKKFSARTLESKRENKLKFQEEIGFVTEAKMPLLCIPGGMTEELGGSDLESVIDGILSLRCDLVIRGIGSQKYGALFTALEKEHSHRICIIQDDDTARRTMYAASDIALFFAHDELEILNCLSYGTVPVSPSQNMLSDYNPVQESGNAFIADPMTKWTWFAALVRAIETYKLPYDFRTIQRHAMETIQGKE